MSSKHTVKIMPGAIVCQEAKLRGDITVGSGTIIHPCAYISAEAGPIVIGDRCLIEEQTRITHRVPFDRDGGDAAAPVLVIGSNNVFEVGCAVEARRVGDGNTFESRCSVGGRVTVTSGCTVGAGCTLAEEQTLPENTTVFGEACERREALCAPMVQTLQMDTLSKMLPNYHRIRKQTQKS